MSIFSNPLFLASKGALTVSMTDHRVNVTGANPLTFSAVALGTASSSRKIVLGIMTGGGSTSTISGVTVGGNAATSIGSVVDTSSNTTRVDLWYIDLAAGTSGDVIVTWAVAPGSAALGVWNITNSTPGAPAASQTQAVNSAGANALAINVTAGGVCIGYAGMNQSGADPTAAAWTNLTSDFSETIGAGARRWHSGASAQTGTTQSLTVTMTPTNADGSVLILAAFK